MAKHTEGARCHKKAAEGAALRTHQSERGGRRQLVDVAELYYIHSPTRLRNTSNGNSFHVPHKATMTILNPIMVAAIARGNA